MKAFKEPNLSNKWECPICNTADKKEVVLIGIVGTEEDNNMEREQFHLDCIDLLYDKQTKILYQKI